MLFSIEVYAKKRCKPFLEKLHKIQAAQRSGYSLKRGDSLRVKEDKARNKWWKCENTSKSKFNALYGKKKTKSKKATKSKRKNSVKHNVAHQKLKLTPLTIAKAQQKKSQYSSVVIKSAYQGDKQAAWLTYYQKPKQCKQPKNMADFVFCHEDKRKQQDKFDLRYRDTFNAN